MNGIGALFWVVGLYLAVGVSHAETWGVWLPAHSLPIGAFFGAIGLALLLWANLIDA